MHTAAASSAADLVNLATDRGRSNGPDISLSTADLLRLGASRGQVRAAVAAGRWQRVGRAFAMPNGELSLERFSSA